MKGAPEVITQLNKVLLQKVIFDTFVENRVLTFQRVTAVKNRTFRFLQQNPSA